MRPYRQAGSLSHQSASASICIGYGRKTFENPYKRKVKTVRMRKLKIFTIFFIALTLLAAYGLALMRTYVFKPPASSSSLPAAVALLEKR